MVDFTKMSVAEIREKLINAGCPADEATSIKGRAALVERLMEIQGNVNQSADFGNVTYDEEVTVEKNETKVNVPKMGSPGWQDYVLQHLTQDEYSEKDGRKFPRACGLRRVTQLICGPIISSGPQQVWPPSGSNHNATVVYHASILWTQGMNIPEWMSESDIADFKLQTRTFTEVADCSLDNTPAPYNLHPCATAASKAEGRVFKKVLQLSVTTAEEMSSVGEVREDKEEKVAPSLDSTNFDNESASTNQVTMIGHLCSRLGIDVDKALSFHGLPSTNALSRSQASQMVILLNKYQTGTEASLEIPDIIKV